MFVELDRHVRYLFLRGTVIDSLGHGAEDDVVYAERAEVRFPKHKFAGAAFWGRVPKSGDV